MEKKKIVIPRLLALLINIKIISMLMVLCVMSLVGQHIDMDVLLAIIFASMSVVEFVNTHTNTNKPK
jgi:hypothetical protein